MNQNNEPELSRRNILAMMLGLPLSLLPSTLSEGISIPMTEEVLSACSMATSVCWNLMNVREFGEVASILAIYLPALEMAAQKYSRYQERAADITSQCYRLKGILALHFINLKAREAYCEQAKYYSRIARNVSLEVAALTSLASTFYYHKEPIKAAYSYREALSHQKEITPLQLARLHAELAVVSAQLGQEQEALSYQSIAHRIYPEHPEQDLSFFYAEFSPASAILEEGLVYLALTSHYPNRRYAQRAWNAFVQIESLQSQAIVPERIFYEILNHQAEVALALRDRELFCSLMQRAIPGARHLNSQQRRQEAITIYNDASHNVWPHELQVRELKDLF